MRTLSIFLAALLIAPTFAASPPVVIDPAALVKVAAGKSNEEKADAKPAAGKQAGAKKAGATETKKKPQPKAAKKAGKKPDPKSAKKSGQSSDKKAAAKSSGKDKDVKAAGRLADFGKTQAPEDVVHVANWVAYTGNHKKYAFFIIDKKKARVYAFDNKAKLRGSAPVLLGEAVGDHTAPGVGAKRLSELAPHEKTTPAGWFPANPGVNNHGEDVIWIDYDSGVSMHRMRPVDPKERRAHRLATPTHADNRISNGCVNVPPKFYDSVLKPLARKPGAYVFVLPETKTPQQLFASFDVPSAGGKGVQVAQASDKDEDDKGDRKAAK